MAGERERGTAGDADWIFASDDPHTLPTEQLPDRAAFDRYAAPLLERKRAERAQALQAQLAEDAERAGNDSARPSAEQAGTPGSPTAVRSPLTPSSAAPPWPTGEPRQGTARRLVDWDLDTEDREAPGQGRPGEAVLPSRTTSYARSGTTPNVEDRASGIEMPERFRELGVFDALRDLLALVCLVTALTTTFTFASVPILDTLGKVSIGIGLAALIAVHLLRWIPAQPPLNVVRMVRVVGLLPALLTALIVVVADLAASLPVLFSSLPDGPPVGIGVGVPLLLLGAIVGMEPRAHEGYLPHLVARNRARLVVLGIGVAAAAALLLALVMIVGRLFTTGWGFSLRAFADALISALLLGIVFGAVWRKDRSWIVFSIAAVAGLVMCALADNTLRLQFAAPLSFATGFVYLPALFAAFGLMISRSFVRTIPISFRRVDWLVYTVRAFEFSVLMHGAAVIWHVLAAIASPTGVTPGGPVLHLLDAVVCACFVAVSLFARKALLERRAEVARASGVIAGSLLVVVGFLDTIVNSVATGAGAGLLTGGVAIAVGIATALMLTVPAPVRDEFGAPDLGKMFADFRLRDTRRASLLDQVPDVNAERARKKAFPGG
ncbi:hypothetical protein M3F63_13230 [Brachybacterium muris]|uniref:DUF7937 domain-containing protein n=1 Tax=Brachybacterium muris TaxID=219301 RepID=UPI00223C4369|nr:hypothetical protein [Brachybacterium muris]MCT2178607.1 hypothetical protein [Brachybacterium muris]